MRIRVSTRILTFVAASALSGVVAAAAPATVTGTVSDAMCGKDHMGKDAAMCTRQCAKNGSDYALVSGTKVYTLKTKDTKLRAELDKLAGARATVTGEEDGNTITVSAVTPAK